MTATARQERPSRTELGRCLIESGALASDWTPTFAAVDRAHFLPQVMWPFIPADWQEYEHADGAPSAARSVPVDRAADSRSWYGYADSDLSIVTQWDDGRHRGTDPGTVATSSSSQPSVVYRLLAALDADTGMTVLDAGTGTGETAGLLTHRCGRGNVVTIDVDPAVSAAPGNGCARSACTRTPSPVTPSPVARARRSTACCARLAPGPCPARGSSRSAAAG